MSLRTIVSKSFLGSIIRQRREAEAIRNWSPEDDRKAAFYSHFIKSGDIVFDIGANVGNRVKLFRKLGATVVAVEPQPYCQAVLKLVFSKDAKVKRLAVGVGDQQGTTEMRVSETHVLSSLSPEWLAAVNESKRFAGTQWAKTIPIRLTTLQALIEEHGTPAFIKIDVEGYEPKVIAGLKTPVKALSFEFTYELLSQALACIDALATVGMTEFTYCDGEQSKFATEWSGKDQIRTFLEQLPGELPWGDVYARSK